MLAGRVPWLMLTLPVVLAGCAAGPEPRPAPVSTAAYASNNARPAPTEGAGAAGPTTPGPTAGAPRRGAYYQDDGPGDSAPPINLEYLPDAVPKLEPYSRTANRPYNVFGQDYVPDLSDQPFRQQGMGSWYGRKFHGQRTSSG